MIDLLSGWSVVMLIGCLFGLMSDGFEHLNILVLCGKLSEMLQYGCRWITV